MNISVAVTLEPSEFNKIHDGLNQIRAIAQELDSKVDTGINRRLQKAIGLIENGIRRSGQHAQRPQAIYEDRQQKLPHYQTIQSQNHLMYAWAIYEVNNFEDEHPFPAARHLQFTPPKGGQTVQARIDGPRWLDLWRAANQAMNQLEWRGTTRYSIVGFHVGKRPSNLVVDIQQLI